MNSIYWIRHHINVLSTWNVSIRELIKWIHVFVQVVYCAHILLIQTGRSPGKFCDWVVLQRDKVKSHIFRTTPTEAFEMKLGVAVLSVHRTAWVLAIVMCLISWNRSSEEEHLRWQWLPEQPLERLYEERFPQGHGNCRNDGVNKCNERRVTVKNWQPDDEDAW